MPCEEWFRLLASYRGAVKAYSEAIDGLSSLHGPKFNEAWQLAERARKDSVVSRAALLCHEHVHGCSTHQPFVEGHQDLDVNTEDLVLGDLGQPGG